MSSAKKLKQNQITNNTCIIDAVSATLPKPQQQGLQQKLGCITASFNLQESYYHYFENGSPPPLHRLFDTQNAFDTVWRQVLVYKLYKCGVFGRLRARKIVIHISIFSVTVHQRTTFKNKKINPFTQVNTILKGRTQIYLSDDIAIFALS